MTKRLAVFAAFVGLAIGSSAQERQPRGTAEAKVGGKSVVIDYGRPALKGRSIDELMKNLPEDRVWRAGENQVTTISTDSAIKIGGTEIPAGKYSLYILAPTDGDWSLLVNKHLGTPLKELWDQAPSEVAQEPWPELRGYKMIGEQEVARIPLKKKSGKSTDVFTIDLSSSELSMSWGDLAWGASIAAAN